MAVRLHLLICGRVQGVGFRFFTLETARKLNIAGWVRNLPNGEVEAEAEAQEQKTLERFLDELRKGNSFARVDSIETREVPVTGTQEPFDIY